MPMFTLPCLACIPHECMEICRNGYGSPCIDDASVPGELLKGDRVVGGTGTDGDGEREAELDGAERRLEDSVTTSLFSAFTAGKTESLSCEQWKLAYACIVIIAHQ